MRLSAIRIPRRHRRAILIYILTLVTPVGLLLWLGIRSFERQREALATLRAEKLAAAIEARTREAAERALEDSGHPMVVHRFVFERGELVRPALRAPLPAALPAAFVEAEILEVRSAAAALARYRSLAAEERFAPLALSRVARSLSKLGREEEAVRTWKTLAARYPAARDPHGRPYGIVARIQAGDTDGLRQEIVRDAWDLSADHAEYFLAQLGAAATEPYLDRFRFARELVAGFRPPGGLSSRELRTDIVAARQIFYQMDDAGRLVGFAADAAWLDALASEVQTELGIAGPEARDLRIHIGAVALVSLLLTAGVVLLVRDSSREARTSQLRAEFVSGVSHELKTPITLLRLYGETLLRHERLGDDERRDFYRIIMRESARLGRLVDQILSFARLERGALDYDLREGDLAALTAGIVDDYREWLEHAGFRVEAAVPETAPPVRFDPAAVTQTLVNLLDNAAKYSGASREIGVRLESDPYHVSIEVEDHGVGIRHAEQSRIFERFYRAGGATGKGGYGLGLFMVRHIMDVHGGRVEVDSEPGRGSRFRLIFRIAAA